MQKFNPDGENTDLTEEQIDEVEQYIESAKEAGWNADRTFRLLSKLGYTYAIGNSAEAFKNYLADRLSGETNIKVTSEFNINKEIDAELAALEGTKEVTYYSLLEKAEKNVSATVGLNFAFFNALTNAIKNKEITSREQLNNILEVS